MKRVMATVAAFACAIVLAGCSATGSSSASSAASDQSSASEQTASVSASQSVPDVTWTSAGTAEEAAKGAGLKRFGVPKSASVGGVKFKSPEFGYAGGVAQATYANGTTNLVVRKGKSGVYTAPLTARAESEFPKTWKNTYAGLDVTQYGMTEGAASLIKWSNGVRKYAVTVQGIGNGDPTMTSDDVKAIVKAIKKADASEKKKTADQASAASEQKQDNSGYISEDDAKNAAIAFVGLGLPETVMAELVTDEDAPYYSVTLTSEGETHIVEIDALTGAVWSDTLDSEYVEYDEDEYYVDEDDVDSDDEYESDDEEEYVDEDASEDDETEDVYDDYDDEEETY